MYCTRFFNYSVSHLITVTSLLTTHTATDWQQKREAFFAISFIKQLGTNTTIIAKVSQGTSRWIKQPESKFASSHSYSASTGFFEMIVGDLTNCHTQYT
jgi:hypothetical protein